MIWHSLSSCMSEVLQWCPKFTFSYSPWMFFYQEVFKCDAWKPPDFIKAYFGFLRSLTHILRVYLSLRVHETWLLGPWAPADTGPTCPQRRWTGPECVYLSHRRFQNKQMGRSRRKSCGFPPHSDPGSGRVRRSCCSSRDNQPGPRGWPLLSPPGPGWHHLAAESECSRGSPFVWMPSHLRSQTENSTTNGMLENFFKISFISLRADACQPLGALV